MTTPTLSTHADPPKPRFAMAAGVEQIDRTARALAAHGFTVEVLDSAQAARTRVAALLPVGAAVYTAASETLRLSGIEVDINGSDRFVAIKPRVWALDRQTQGDQIRRLTATPDFVVGSVSAVTEGGALVAVSASGSQLPAYAGGASKVIWVVGAQKIVTDLAGALRRIETYAYPLEDVRGPCNVRAIQRNQQDSHRQRRADSRPNHRFATPPSHRLLRKEPAMSNTSANGIQVAGDDLYDRPYRFAQPLNYLSQREQARLLILRGRLHEQPRAELRLNATVPRD